MKLSVNCASNFRSRNVSHVALVVVVLLHLKHVATQQRKGGTLGPHKADLTTSQEWIQKSLETHNFFRSLHGIPPLVLNDSLSQTSQYYANYLLKRTLQTLDRNGNGQVYFEHSVDAGKAGIGENLYYSIMTAPINPIPSSYAVLLWYEEIKDYDFEMGDRKTSSHPKAMIGHLTQLLWKGTKEMGTAYATHKLGNNQTLVFVVAHYYRQGNIKAWDNPRKLYLTNVLPPLRSRADINSDIVSMNVKSWVSEFEEPKSKTPSSWREAALKAHNYYRNLHGSQELRLNVDMCKVGQLWVEHLVEGGLRTFNYNGVISQIQTNFIALKLCNMGESSMMSLSQSDKPSANFIVKSWYGQKEKFDFDTGAPKDRTMKTEKFQQMIWNSTTEFCISYASRQTEQGQYITYVVANYYPAVTQLPNPHERKQNIPPPISEPDVDVYFDDEEKCSTLPLTILIVMLTLIVILCSFVGVMFIMRKHQKPLYNSIMKFLRLKKY